MTSSPWGLLAEVEPHTFHERVLDSGDFDVREIKEYVVPVASFSMPVQEPHCECRSDFASFRHRTFQYTLRTNASRGG